jgi:hypothetical protein
MVGPLSRVENLLTTAAEKKRDEKAKEAGDLCCPVCAAVGTTKRFTSVSGFVGHLNDAHIALQVPVPEEYWAAQSIVRCCRQPRAAAVRRQSQAEADRASAAVRARRGLARC